MALVVFVPEGTGPLLRIRLLPSGPGQVFEERILSEGEWTGACKHIYTQINQ